MANLGWGLDPWGLGFYGGLLGPLSVQSAFAITTRTVRVTVSVPPADNSVSGIGDALNPATWSVTRLDTGFVFTVASIDEVNETTFDITVVEAFGALSVTHQVLSTTLRKDTGELIEAPYSASFIGLIASDVATPEAQLAKRKLIPQDISNPFVDGTLVMTSGGDYALVSGAALVRKLIFRRLISQRGSFFHLPNYGLGFAVKEPLVSSDLVMLRKEVIQQISLEPEIEQADASLTLSATGILVLTVRGRLRPTGENFEQSFSLPSSGAF